MRTSSHTKGSNGNINDKNLATGSGFGAANSMKSVSNGSPPSYTYIIRLIYYKTLRNIFLYVKRKLNAFVLS